MPWDLYFQFVTVMKRLSLQYSVCIRLSNSDALQLNTLLLYVF